MIGLVHEIPTDALCLGWKGHNRGEIWRKDAQRHTLSLVPTAFDLFLSSSIVMSSVYITHTMQDPR